MRLGYYSVKTAADLDVVAEKLDGYGLSAVWADVANNSDAECVALRKRAAQLGIVLGECGMWENLMSDDMRAREDRIARTRTLLQKADLAGVKCVVTLAGTKHPEGGLLPHAANYTTEYRRELRDVVRHILEGLDLRTVGYGIEPWHNTFFYQPEDIREFIDSVGHPRFGLHLDLMNMVSQKDFFHTTRLINRTFDLLADKVFSVHLKDIACAKHMFLRWDEARIGEGVMDYNTYLKRLAQLPKDITCYCEHFDNEGDYAICFARLHHLAEKNGVHFLRRNQ